MRTHCALTPADGVRTSMAYEQGIRPNCMVHTLLNKPPSLLLGACPDLEVSPDNLQTTNEYSEYSGHGGRKKRAPWT